MKLIKTADDIVLEIHNKIDTAQERLLQEALNIINSTSIKELDSDLVNKAKKIKGLGFTSTNIVVGYNEQNEENEQSTELILENREKADTILHYKNTYPFLKFLTEDELTSICEDYDLHMGPVGTYIKDVPTKNLNEIDDAQALRSEDNPIDRVLVKLNDDSLQFSFGEKQTKASKKFIKMASKGVMIDSKKGTGWREPEYDINVIMKEEFNADGIVTSWQSIHTEAFKINRDGLFICAPIKHFDTKGLKKSGRGFFNFTPLPTDPIVFRYVKGGVQVLSKWGLEADDYRLVQENLN